MIVPVIDLLNRCVVHGQGGRRETYRPLNSPLADASRPDLLARAFARQYTCLYMADLDAIAGHSPDWELYRQVSNSFDEVWLDLGIDSVQRLQEFYRQLGPGAAAIIALETLPDRQSLDELFQAAADPSGLIFSLDLVSGQPRTRAGAGDLDSVGWAQQAYTVGYRRWIVLDVATVGTAAGATTLDLCRRLHTRYPDVTLISGGGVRSRSDVQRLHDAGCQAVLVATALHHGWL